MVLYTTTINIVSVFTCIYADTHKFQGGLEQSPLPWAKGFGLEHRIDNSMG